MIERLALNRMDSLDSVKPLRRNLDPIYSLRLGSVET